MSAAELERAVTDVLIEPPVLQNRIAELGEEISPATNVLVQDLLQRLEAAAIPGIRELSPGYRSLLVAYNPLGESCHYPDSKKWVVRSPERRLIRSEPLDYYDGEE